MRRINNDVREPPLIDKMKQDTTLPSVRDNIAVMGNEKGTTILMRPAKRNASRILPVTFTAVAVLYLLFSLRNPFIFYYNKSSVGFSSHFSSPSPEITTALVPLEAHIMSKSEDTKVCPSELLQTPNTDGYRTA